MLDFTLKMMDFVLQNDGFCSSGAVSSVAALKIERAKEDEFTDVGLNAALREELLFWTMLGMRTASQQAHEEWTTMDKERGHGRMVDAVDIDLRAALQEDGAVRETLARAKEEQEKEQVRGLHRKTTMNFV